MLGAVALLLASVAATAFADNHPPLQLSDASLRWSLPGRLVEISGLAMSPDHRLFAMDDEIGVIYQIDYESGRLLKAFALGKPVVKKDFEGIAVLGDLIYLMTSDGVLYVAPEGEDGERVDYRKIDTGLKKQCEFEGLATDPSQRRLLLLCKSVRKKADIDTVSIYEWDPEAEQVVNRIRLPIDAISAALRVRHLHPSGIVFHPGRGTYLIVAAREQALIEIDTDGSMQGAIMLPSPRLHPQTEGIEIGPGGELILADEGRGARARLAVYPAIGTRQE